MVVVQMRKERLPLPLSFPRSSRRGNFTYTVVTGSSCHPYLTMDPAFEAEEVKIFGEMYKKGVIYKGLKPVYWCPHDETALAEAEIEYQEDPVTTVYVKFPLRDDLGKPCRPPSSPSPPGPRPKYRSRRSRP